MDKIASVETAGFGRLEDGKVEFGAGLNCVQALNEGGKTFLTDALCVGLFEDGANSSEKFQNRYRKWKDDGDFFVRLELEHEDKHYVLTRDFGEKTNTLMMPDGAVLRDKRKIAAVVESIIGLPTAKAYRATAFIPQEEAALVCGETSLREMLEKQINGAGSDTNLILKRLDRASASILSKNGKNGELEDLRTMADELKDTLLDQEGRLKVLAANKRELASVEAELEDKHLELDSDEAAGAGFRRYLEAKDQQDKAGFGFEVAEEDLDMFRQTTKDVAQYKAALKESEKKATALQDEIEKAARAVEAEEALQRLQKEAGSLGKKLEAIGKLDTRMAALDKKLGNITAVPLGDLKKARSLASKVESLEAALTQSIFNIKVKPESGAAFTLEADGESIKGKEATAHVAATVGFPGSGTVYISNLTGEKEPLVDQVQRAAEKLESVLKKYDVTEVAELEELHSRREALETERQSLEDRKAGLLGDDDHSELQACQRDLKAELRKAERTRDKYKSASLPNDVIKYKKGELKAFQGECKRHEKALSECVGAFNVLGKDEQVLQKAKAAAAKTLAVADEAVRENAPFACSGADYARRQRGLERLRQKVDSLKASKLILETRISAEAIGQEDVSATAEQLAQKEAAVERFSREHDLLTTIAENIRRAREKAIASLSGGMQKRMGTVLSEITDKRYKSASVDGNLSMRVYSPDKGELIDIGNGDEPFSTGACDQMFLSARLALLEAITGDSKTPLILDDSFVNFDPERKERALEMLEALSANRQVIYCTCNPVPDHITRTDVVLAGGTKGSKK